MHTRPYREMASQKNDKIGTMSEYQFDVLTMIWIAKLRSASCSPPDCAPTATLTCPFAFNPAMSGVCKLRSLEPSPCTRSQLFG